MAKTKPELSRNNKYWINKHRHYELKHFCLQYPIWKRIISEDDTPCVTSSLNRIPSRGVVSDPTSRAAIRQVDMSNKIQLIEMTVKETDCDLQDYILKAVTEGLSYTQLKSRLDIPCSRDTYYDRYRRFFWLLDKIRD